MRAAFSSIHRGPSLPVAHLMGLGDTPGCPPSSLSEAMAYEFTNPMAFIGMTASDVLQAAQGLCQESAAGAPFGCPPMSGCDPASIAAIANQMVSQYVASGYQPGYAPPTPGGWQQESGPTFGAPTPAPTFVPLQPPAPHPPPPDTSGGSTPAPQQQQQTQPPPAAGGSTTDKTASSSSSSSGGLNFLTDSAVAGIPNWALIGAGIAALVILPMVLKGGK